MAETNAAQIDYWNGRAGEKWTAKQADLDAMLGPVADLLMAQAGDVAGLRVLDIGCGTGQSCLLLADRGARVTGADVSAPMLALAEQRLGGRARVVQADVATWQGDAPFDLGFSRFGVMFFDDPAAALANIAANLKPGGRLLFACWRRLSENPWVVVPLSALREILPEAPPQDPFAPGPFAFADADRLTGLLERAGFENIRIAAHDVPVQVAGSGGARAAAKFVMQIGPAGAALAEAPQGVKEVALDLLMQALAPFDQDGKVALGGAIWIVEGVKPLPR